MYARNCSKSRKIHYRAAHGRRLKNQRLNWIRKYFVSKWFKFKKVHPWKARIKVYYRYLKRRVAVHGRKTV